MFPFLLSRDVAFPVASLPEYLSTEASSHVTTGRQEAVDVDSEEVLYGDG